MVRLQVRPMGRSYRTSPARRPSVREMPTASDAVFMERAISALVSASATPCGRGMYARIVTAADLGPHVQEYVRAASLVPAPVAVEEPASLAPPETAHVNVSEVTPAHPANSNAQAVSQTHVTVMVLVHQMRVYATQAPLRGTGTVPIVPYVHLDMVGLTARVFVELSTALSAATAEAVRTEAVAVNQATVEPHASSKVTYVMNVQRRSSQ
jgi:hypothetical protein